MEFTHTDNPYNYPLRQWIYQEFIKWFPTERAYRSNDDDPKIRAIFFQWIPKDQGALEKIWKEKSTFSACSSFVAILVTRIRQAGGLWPKSGLPPLFQTFDLSLNKKGWHWATDTTQQPSVGDIYAVGKPGAVKHVGVILNSTGDAWQTVEAGQGLIGQYDGITRKPWHVPDATKLMGWINVDEYFDTWGES